MWSVQGLQGCDLSREIEFLNGFLYFVFGPSGHFVSVGGVGSRWYGWVGFRWIRGARFG